MRKTMHLIVPMSGQGRRFQQAGYRMPKPLVPINGVSIVERQLRMFPERWFATFIMAENHRQMGLPEALQKARPNGRQLFIDPNRLGPSHAVSLALSDVPDDQPIFISYCDYGMQWDAAAFENFVADSGCDVAVVSYRGFHPHYLGPQMYAYSRLSHGRVVEIREKACFTADREQEFASSGGYYFRRAETFKRAYAAQQAAKMHLDGEFYTSLTIQALLQQEPTTDVRVYEVPAFFQWGTPDDLAQYAYWEKSYRAQLRRTPDRGVVSQLLMPMAGLGSRFGALFDDPKPFLKVAGRDMFVAALQTLPEAERVIVVTRAEAAKRTQAALQAHGRSATLVEVEMTPRGQALTCLTAAPVLEAQAELVVSACDHGIVVGRDIWPSLRDAPDCDAAIMTVQGYPGAARKPHAYAYVEPLEGDDRPHPLVRRLSFKRPLSPNPIQDHVLTGTFWFRRAESMLAGIEALRTKGGEVGGELYLDSIFEILIEMGLKVRMVPLEGYLCWGDPDVYAEAAYWHDVFMGQRGRARPRY